MEDIDLYSDLPLINLNNIDDNEQKEDKKSKKSDEKILELIKLLDNLKSDKKKLEKNFSSLMKTAKQEIIRKDRIISDLREKINNLTFRRNQRYTSSQQNWGHNFNSQDYSVTNSQNYCSSNDTQNYQFPPPSYPSVQNNVKNENNEQLDYANTELHKAPSYSKNYKEAYTTKNHTPNGVRSKKDHCNSDDESDDEYINKANYISTVYGERLRKKLAAEEEENKKLKAQAENEKLKEEIKIKIEKPEKEDENENKMQAIEFKERTIEKNEKRKGDETQLKYENIIEVNKEKRKKEKEIEKRTKDYEEFTKLKIKEIESVGVLKKEAEVNSETDLYHKAYATQRVKSSRSTEDDYEDRSNLYRNRNKESKWNSNGASNNTIFDSKSEFHESRSQRDPRRLSYSNHHRHRNSQYEKYEHKNNSGNHRSRNKERNKSPYRKRGQSYHYKSRNRDRSNSFERNRNKFYQRQHYKERSISCDRVGIIMRCKKMFDKERSNSIDRNKENHLNQKFRDYHNSEEKRISERYRKNISQNEVQPRDKPPSPCELPSNSLEERKNYYGFEDKEERDTKQRVSENESQKKKDKKWNNYEILEKQEKIKKRHSSKNEEKIKDKTQNDAKNKEKKKKVKKHSPSKSKEKQVDEEQNNGKNEEKQGKKEIYEESKKRNDAGNEENRNELKKEEKDTNLCDKFKENPEKASKQGKNKKCDEAKSKKQEKLEKYDVSSNEDENNQGNNDSGNKEKQKKAVRKKQEKPKKDDASVNKNERNIGRNDAEYEEKQEGTENKEQKELKKCAVSVNKEQEDEKQNEAESEDKQTCEKQEEVENKEQEELKKYAVSVNKKQEDEKLNEAESENKQKYKKQEEVENKEQEELKKYAIPVNKERENEKLNEAESENKQKCKKQEKVENKEQEELKKYAIPVNKERENEKLNEAESENKQKCKKQEEVENKEQEELKKYAIPVNKKQEDEKLNEAESENKQKCKKQEEVENKEQEKFNEYTIFVNKKQENKKQSEAESEEKECKKQKKVENKEQEKFKEYTIFVNKEQENKKQSEAESEEKKCRKQEKVENKEQEKFKECKDFQDQEHNDEKQNHAVNRENHEIMKMQNNEEQKSFVNNQIVEKIKIPTVSKNEEKPKKTKFRIPKLKKPSSPEKQLSEQCRKRKLSTGNDAHDHLNKLVANNELIKSLPEKKQKIDDDQQVKNYNDFARKEISKEDINQIFNSSLNNLDELEEGEIIDDDSPSQTECLDDIMSTHVGTNKSIQNSTKHEILSNQPTIHHKIVEINDKKNNNEKSDDNNIEKTMANIHKEDFPHPEFTEEIQKNKDEMEVDFHLEDGNHFEEDLWNDEMIDHHQNVSTSPDQKNKGLITKINGFKQDIYLNNGDKSLKCILPCKVIVEDTNKNKKEYLNLQKIVDKIDYEKKTNKVPLSKKSKIDDKCVKSKKNIVDKVSTIEKDKKLLPKRAVLADGDIKVKNKIGENMNPVSQVKDLIIESNCKNNKYEFIPTVQNQVIEHLGYCTTVENETENDVCKDRKEIGLQSKRIKLRDDWARTLEKSKQKSSKKKEGKLSEQKHSIKNGTVKEVEVTGKEKFKQKKLSKSQEKLFKVFSPVKSIHVKTKKTVSRKKSKRENIAKAELLEDQKSDENQIIANKTIDHTEDSELIGQLTVIADNDVERLKSTVGNISKKRKTTKLMTKKIEVNEDYATEAKEINNDQISKKEKHSEWRLIEFEFEIDSTKSPRKSYKDIPAFKSRQLDYKETTVEEVLKKNESWINISETEIESNFNKIEDEVKAAEELSKNERKVEPHINIAENESNFNEIEDKSPEKKSIVVVARKSPRIKEKLAKAAKDVLSGKLKETKIKAKAGQTWKSMKKNRAESDSTESKESRSNFRDDISNNDKILTNEIQKDTAELERKIIKTNDCSKEEKTTNVSNNNETKEPHVKQTEIKIENVIAKTASNEEKSTNQVASFSDLISPRSKPSIGFEAPKAKVVQNKEPVRMLVPKTAKNVIIVRRRKRPVQLSDSPPVVLVDASGKQITT